jgi:hypothetical protein
MSRYFCGAVLVAPHLAHRVAAEDALEDAESMMLEAMVGSLVKCQMACARAALRCSERVQAQLGQDGIGVLAQRGHGVQPRVARVPAARRQQRGHRAGRGVHLAPALARGQLRVGPQAGHVAQFGVGDLRVFQPLATCSAVSAAKASTISARSASRWALRSALPAKRGSAPAPAAAAPWVQNCLPLAFVLQAQHHRLAVAGGERGRRGRWWRAPRRHAAAAGAVEGVVQRVAHPLGHRFEHADVDAPAPGRRCWRCSSAARMLL